MAEGLHEPVSAFFRLPALALLLPGRQLPQRVENEALLLMLAGYCVLPTKVEGILRLFVEVCSIVECLRQCVARRERQLITHPPVKRERNAVIGRNRKILELIDV